MSSEGKPPKINSIFKLLLKANADRYNCSAMQALCELNSWKIKLFQKKLYYLLKIKSKAPFA
jgi:hypothetical protein